MKDKFIKAVESGDIESVRLFLSNELMLDPRGISFHEMLNFAESKMSNLFDIDNGKTVEKDTALWDKGFLFQVKNELEDNFSREKLKYYERVTKQVLKDKAEQMETEAQESQQNPNYTEQFSQNSDWFNQNKKSVYTGVTIGGAILTTIGLYASKAAIKAVLTTFGGIGLIAGGYLLYKEINKNKQ